MRSFVSDDRSKIVPRGCGNAQLIRAEEGFKEDSNLCNLIIHIYLINN